MSDLVCPNCGKDIFHNTFFILLELSYYFTEWLCYSCKHLFRTEGLKPSVPVGQSRLW